MGYWIPAKKIYAPNHDVLKKISCFKKKLIDQFLIKTS